MPMFGNPEFRLRHRQRDRPVCPSIPGRSRTQEENHSLPRTTDRRVSNDDQFHAHSVIEFPQSGERIVGDDNRRSVYSSFPGRTDGLT